MASIRYHGQGCEGIVEGSSYRNFEATINPWKPLYRNVINSHLIVIYSVMSDVNPTGCKLPIEEPDPAKFPSLAP